MKNSEENENLILKFAEGNCRHDEAIKVIQWFKNSIYRIKLYRALAILWYKKNEMREDYCKIDLNSTLDRLLNRIDTYKEQEESELRERNWYKKLPETPYTMTIEDEKIAQVVEYLSVVSPNSWEMIPAHKLENGKVSKIRYIISKKLFSKYQNPFS